MLYGVFDSLQSQAEKIAKNLESQLAELNAKLEQSAREVLELNAFKSRSQSENAELVRQLEEAEGNVTQLTRLKQTLGKQLDETKGALEEESRIRAKITAENRNLQVLFVFSFNFIRNTFCLSCKKICYNDNAANIFELTSVFW